MEPMLGQDVNALSRRDRRYSPFKKKKHVSRTIRNLSKQFQEVLILKIQYGLKENEIADLLDLKSATVKTRAAFGAKTT